MTLCPLFQIVEPSTSRPKHKLVTALEKRLARRLRTLQPVLKERNELLSIAYLKFKRLQEGFHFYSKIRTSNERIRMSAFNRIVAIRDARAQQRIAHLEKNLHYFYNSQEYGNQMIITAQKKAQQAEDALQAKVLELQEWVKNSKELSQTNPPQESSHLVQKLEADVKNLKDKLQIFQDKLMLARLKHRALEAKITRLECRLDGKEEPKMTPEMKLYQRMEDVKNVTEIYGENSDECRAKQKHLDSHLQAMVETAALETKADYDKHRTKRKASYVPNAKRAEENAP